MDRVKPDRYLLRICAMCLSSSCSVLFNVFKSKLPMVQTKRPFIFMNMKEKKRQLQTDLAKGGQIHRQIGVQTDQG